jgi:predicted DNA binding protein
MISLTLDIQQADCPYIRASDDCDVTMTGLYSDFVESKGKLKTRMFVDGTDGARVERALDAFESYDSVNLCHLISKWDDTAVVKNCTDPTRGMEAVRRHEGYLTAPFEVDDGHKKWYLGFDTSDQADAALAELDDAYDFDIDSHEVVTREEYIDVIQNVSAANALFDSIRNMTETEYRAFRRAFEAGYFETPRRADLQELGAEAGISGTGFSKNLRRASDKLAAGVVEAAESLDEDGGG